MAKQALAALVALATAAAWADVPIAGAVQSNGLSGPAERIRAHVEFLADDDLRGREPGTSGYGLAATYVADTFWRMGLEPAGAGGGWFQPVPLRRARLEPESATLSVWRDGRELSLRFIDQFLRPADTQHRRSQLRAPMVFAGYGIHAPTLGHDDYDGIDVRGKVVVVFSGRPSTLAGDAGAHFGSSQRKREAAEAHGAAGLVTVFTPRNGRRVSWDRQRNRVGEPALDWLDGAGRIADPGAALRGRATVHHTAAGALFEQSGHDLADLFEADEAGTPIPVFELAGEIELGQRSRHDTLTSPNVVARAPGMDPTLAHQHVLYVAHLDHLGARRDEDGVLHVNNGALDNAAGVAVMLETAQAFMAGPRRRSALFLAVTSEETGLVGSDYFARHPTVPLDDIVAVINLDMPMLLYDFVDVVAFGAEHSSLVAPAARAAVEADVSLAPDPFPGRNVFVRSDHYRFVQQGIPSIFLLTGPGGSDRRHMGAWNDFMSDHYHGPTDTTDLEIDWAAAARFARINYRIGWYVSELAERPRWNEGDFFGETFGRGR